MLLIDKINNNLLEGMLSFFKKNKKNQAVLGLSGGVDSALVCSLLSEALGPKNVTALIMPCRGISLGKNTKDALDFANNLKVKTIVVEISHFLKPFSSLVWGQPRQAKANLMPRIRAVVLYNYANSTNCIVVGAGNRTEFTLGYFTKYGDGAADFFPIGGLWKKQVVELAGKRKIPMAIINKAPTAELWKGQTDEGEIGLPYAEIDGILSKRFDEGKTVQEIVRGGYSKAAVLKILSIVQKNLHKSKAAQILQNPYT